MKKYAEDGIAHIFLIVVIVLVVGLVGVFIVKNTSFKLTNNGKTVVDTDPNTGTNQAVSNTNQESSNTENIENETRIVKELVKEHFKNIYVTNLDDAYATTCNYFKEYTSRSKFETVVTTGFFKAVDLSIVDYTEADVISSQARLKGKIGPLMPDKMLEVDLLKENTKWCIAGYRTV